jgi:hypothetical protein
MKGIEFKKLTAILMTLTMIIMLIPIISLPASAATEVTNEAELKSALDSGATDITISGTVTISSNSLTINSGVTLTIPDSYTGSLTINSGVTLTVKGTISGWFTNRGTIVNIGTIEDFYNYGTVNNNKGGTINGRFHNYYGGTISNNGKIANVNSYQITNEGIIDNSGTIDNSGCKIENWYTIINSGTIDNHGGTIENRCGGGSIKGTIENSGKIDNSGGGSIRNELYCAITNSGTIDNNGGTIWNGGTINGKIANLDKGVFDNVGTYNENNGKGNSATDKPSTSNNALSNTDSNSSNDDGQSGDNNGVLLIVAVVAVLAIVGGCALLLLRKRK